MLFVKSGLSLFFPKIQTVMMHRIADPAPSVTIGSEFNIVLTPDLFVLKGEKAA
jgi:hypothetical protein